MKQFLIFLLSITAVCSFEDAASQNLGSREIEVRQENRIDSRKSAKKSSKKEQRAAEREVAYVSALALLDARDFVLEGNKLSMPDGSSLAVFSDVNYIMMKGDKAVVQVNPGISGGPNGMGGITLEGSVIDFQRTRDKRGNVKLKYTVMTTGGSAEVELTLMAGGDKANATITPKLRSARVIMFGKLLATENSRVFKGFSM